jgi:hypothetical protein
VWVVVLWRVVAGLRHSPGAAYAWITSALLPVVLSIGAMSTMDRVLKNNTVGLLSWFLVGLAFASVRGGEERS